MSFILNIETAVESASVCLSKHAESIAVLVNTETRESAAWLHTAIQQLLQQQNITLQHVDAVAVSAGPGSYTGLRVGMATAKGLCFALQKPLITLNTLQIMASAARAQGIASAWLCPMIDARRMEVFTALYDQLLNEVAPTGAVILNETFLADYLQQQPVTFFGNGSNKLQTVLQHANAVFADVTFNATHLAPLAYEKLMQNNFTDLAYSEPLYGKDFFNTAHNK